MHTDWSSLSVKSQQIRKLHKISKIFSEWTKRTVYNLITEAMLTPSVYTSKAIVISN